MLKNLLVLLHITTAAAWFGLALILGTISRKAAANGDDGLRVSGAKTVGLMSTFILLTLLFGLGALFAGGGFGVYGPRYHTSLTLIVVLVLVQFLMIRPGWSALVSGNEAGGKKIAMGTGIGHLLWFVVLILMLWTQYPLF